MAALIGCDDDGHRERLSDGEERICAGGRTDADRREGGRRARDGGGVGRRRRPVSKSDTSAHLFRPPRFSQPTPARPRTAQTNFFPGRMDDSYKMNRRGRNGTRKVSHNWPFLLEQAAHVGALQAGALLLLLLLLLSFSVRRANQSISFESSSSVLFPPPPSPPFPPPPSGEKERLGPSDRRRSCISRRWQQHSLPICCEIVQHFKWDVYDTSAKCLPVKMAWAMHMIHTRICPFIEDTTQGRR